MTRSVGLVLVMAMSMAACSTFTDAPEAQTTSPASATAISIGPATPTTDAPVPTTTEPEAIGPQVPLEVGSYHLRFTVDGVQSEPGVSDTPFSYFIEGDVGRESFRVTQSELFGFEVVGERELVSFDSQVWVRDHRKPWLEGNSFDTRDVTRLEFQDFADLYPVVERLDGEPDVVGGIDMVRYKIPMDQYQGSRAIPFVPSRMRSLARDSDTLTMSAWFDANTGLLRRVEFKLTGPQSLLDDYFTYVPSDVAMVSMNVSVEYSQFEVEDLDVARPDLVADATDTTFVFTDDDFGFEVELPVTWVVFPAESYGGFDIPLFTVPKLLDPEDVSFSVAVEDLSGIGGVRVEEYAELNIDSYLDTDADLRILESEATEFLGLPAHRIVAEITEPDLVYVVDSINVIDGSEGWSVDFTGYSGWYDETADIRSAIFDSFKRSERGDEAA